MTVFLSARHGPTLTDFLLVEATTPTTRSDDNTAHIIGMRREGQEDSSKQHKMMGTQSRLARSHSGASIKTPTLTIYLSAAQRSDQSRSTRHSAGIA